MQHLILHQARVDRAFEHGLPGADFLQRKPKSLPVRYGASHELLDIRQRRFSVHGAIHCITHAHTVCRNQGRRRKSI